MSDKHHSIDRRSFMKTSAAAVAGSAMLAASAASAKDSDDGLDHRNERPDRMSYRKLGRTNFMCSRLVFGCGAALAGGKAVRLLEETFENGINHYDVGYDDYYKGSEKSLAEFANRHRDEVWITSKAPIRGGTGMGGRLEYNLEMAKADAAYWTSEMDKSLSRLKLDYLDAYYLMMVGNPKAMRSEELNNAFLKAKEAGKVGHWGFSSHLRAHECLEAAIETGWYSLAMIAITPAGWYDYITREIVEDKGTLKGLKPVLDRARDAGIGLVGMKVARHIATNPYGGNLPGHEPDKVEVSVYDHLYEEGLMKAALNPYQRSYAYVLRHGMDVVNSDMQNFKHFRENLVAARDNDTFFA